MKGHSRHVLLHPHVGILRRARHRPNGPTAAPPVPQSRTWQLGDRRGSDASVKLLQLQAHGQAPLAIALEVAYHPLGAPALAGPVLGELAETLMSALEGGPEGGRWAARAGLGQEGRCQ